jgi:endo-1,4-beta-xylanase
MPFSSRLLPIVASFSLALAARTSLAQAEPPPGFQLEGERWTYQDDTLKLQGILLKPEGKGPFPAVLISHGLGGSASSFSQSKAREFVQWGLVCIACDYAHAASPGRRPNAQGPERAEFGASEENLRRAARCLDILCSLPEVDPQRLCAYGHSMGGFVTIGLAAQAPERLRAAAITGSGVAPRSGFPAPSIELAGKIKTPFIIFHGDADNTVRPAQSQSLQQVLDRNQVANERHVFAGAGHPVDQERRDEVFELTRKWFQKHGVLAATDETATAAQPTPQLRPRPSQKSAAAPAQWLREKIEAKNSHYKMFRSATIDSDVSYLIYLPAEYEQKADQRFPVMYWLHGIGGSQAGVPRFVERMDAAIAAGKIPAMLIVFVNGIRDSFYCDDAENKVPVESVIVKDLVPHIDATYRTVAKREGRLIEGFSMGGFGAAHLGFKHPELFGSVSMIDAALLDVRSMQNRHAALYQRIFAGEEARFEAEHPRTLAQQNAESIRGNTAIRFAVGALLGGNEALRDELKRLDIAHDYDRFDVGHNHAAIYENLGEKNWEFYRRALARRD